MALVDLTGSVGTSFPTIQMPEDGDDADASDFLASTVQKLLDFSTRLRARALGSSSSSLTKTFGVGNVVLDTGGLWVKDVSSDAYLIQHIRTATGYDTTPDSAVFDLTPLVPPVGTITGYGLWVWGYNHSSLPTNQFSCSLYRVSGQAGAASPSAATRTLVGSGYTQSEATVGDLNEVNQIGETVSSAITSGSIYQLEVEGPNGTNSVVGCWVLGGWVSFSE